MNISKLSGIMFIIIMLFLVILVIYELATHPMIIIMIIMYALLQVFIEEFVDILYNGNIIEAIRIIKFMYLLGLCLIIYYTLLI